MTNVNPMGGILRTESRHMPIEAYLALANYAGDLSQTSLPEYQVIRHIVTNQGLLILML